MSVDPQRGAPAAPSGDLENTAAPGDPASAPAPVAPAAPAAAPAVESKAERDRRAAEGRERQRMAQIVQQQNQQIAQLMQTVNAMGAQFSAAEQRRVEAELAQLDPLERAEAKINMLEARIAGTQSRPTAPLAPPPVRVPTPQSDIEETRARAQVIVDGINAELGTDLSVDDDGLDWSEAAPFQASAYRLAAQRVRAQGAVPAAPTGDAVPAKKAETEAEVTARITEQVRRDLGISSPASPQPTGPRATGGIPTEDDLQKTVTGYNSKLGPRATRQKLLEQREALAKAAGV